MRCRVLFSCRFETSANAIAFTLHHLSQPSSAAVLAKVLAEVDALGPPGTVPSHDQLLSGLTWVEACLMETLRLTPPAPYVFRQVRASRARVTGAAFWGLGTGVAGGAEAVADVTRRVAAQVQERMPLAGCPGVVLREGTLMQVRAGRGRVGWFVNPGRSLAHHTGDATLVARTRASRQVSICGVHRNPECWPRPDDYLPERWVPAASSNTATATSGKCAQGWAPARAAWHVMHDSHSNGRTHARAHDDGHVCRGGRRRGAGHEAARQLRRLRRRRADVRGRQVCSDRGERRLQAGGGPLGQEGGSGHWRRGTLRWGGAWRRPR